MWSFAWRNLLTRPMRTALALVGLSIPILGVIGLYSVSDGLRALVGDTISQIQGVVVLREDALSPVFSDMPTEVIEQLRAVPGVRAVAPEVWKVAPRIESRGSLGANIKGILGAAAGDKAAQQSLLDKPVVSGQDIPSHLDLKTAIFPRHIIKGPEGGRFLDMRDRGQPHIVISRKVSKDFADPATKQPRKVGDSLNIGGKSFEIIGIYDTGSMLLDVIILMDIDVARDLLGVSPETVSSCYVEMDDPAAADAMAAVIEKSLPGYDARAMTEIQANFGSLMGQLETFLLMTVALALLVGVVGIVNTMLMSTTERFAEFGVLRTNGWSRGAVLGLVTRESAYLGFLSGLVGSVLALAAAAVANQFLGGGLELTITPRLIGLGLGLSVAMGTLGGLIPAWRASRLVPMDAIRLGSR